MKKLMLIVAMIMLFSESFSQQTQPAPSLSKQDYLKKSKNQKTAAWILLGGGLAMMITGGVLQVNEMQNEVESDPNNPLAPLNALTAESKSGGFIFMTGILAGVGSIPLFIASSRNRRKAASISFKNERFQYLKNSSLAYKPMPAVSIKIDL